MNFEPKHKHLDFIQLIITRMAANSFLIKGWNVTLVAAMFVVANENSLRKAAIASVLVTIIFWVQDSFFLEKERKYRELYEKVSKMDYDRIDYSLKIDTYRLSNKYFWTKLFFSETLLTFYLGVILTGVLFIFV